MVAGTAKSVLMVESEASGLSEEVMLGAVVFGHEQMQVAIKTINEMVAAVGKPKWDWKPNAASAELDAAVAAAAQKTLSDAYLITEKQDRSAKVKEIKAAAIAGAVRWRCCRSTPPTTSTTRCSSSRATSSASASSTASRASTAATRRRFARSP